ncbi:hypothetical protein ES702_05514 [subsurface metagenome]
MRVSRVTFETNGADGLVSQTNSVVGREICKVWADQRVVTAGFEILSWVVAEVDPEFGGVFGVGVGEAIGQIFPDFAVVAVVAEGLFVGGLEGTDCYVVWEGDDWDWEGWGCWGGDGGG